MDLQPGNLLLILFRVNCMKFLYVLIYYDIVDEEFERHMQNAMDACQAGEGDGLSCHRAAEFLQVYKKDYKAAADIYIDNCEKRDFAASCFNLARLTGKLILKISG